MNNALLTLFILVLIALVGVSAIYFYKKPFETEVNFSDKDNINAIIVDGYADPIPISGSENDADLISEEDILYAQ